MVILEKLNKQVSDINIAGLAYLPQSEAHTTACVLTHGFTASKESLDLMAAYLAIRGYQCLTHDVRGHKLGATGGELAHVDQAIADLHAVVDWAKERFGVERVVLIGHSMGAMLSLSVAPHRNDVAAVVSIATGPQPSRGFHGMVGKAMLEARGDYVAGTPAIDLVHEFDVATNSISPLGSIPALFVAAKQDALVSAAAMRILADRVASEAELVEIDANHLEAPQRCRGIVAGWLDRIL
jgi:pimeloyl-ACP methyl ester carboxylesterase